MADIYAFDNKTGLNIPSKIGTYPVELLLGNTSSEVLNSINKGSKLFILFTHLVDSDIVVYSNDDKDVLEDLLEFGKYNYTVSVKDKGVWYSNNATKNIIISDSVNISSNELSHLLNLFISNSKDMVKETKEMYIVRNERNGKVLFKTPLLDEAEEMCNKEPCAVVRKRSTREIIYRSRYGKVAIQYKREDIENNATPNAKVKYVIAKIK